jgi:GcrA cell cycle regulator
LEWSSEQDGLLRQLRNEGLSFGLIVRKFTALGHPRSKGSIVGRANRLNIPGALQPSKHLPRHKPRFRSIILASGAAVSALLRRRTRPAAVRNTNIDTAAEPFLGIALIDLNQNHCRYPEGDDPILFCGQPALKGSPYCVTHTKLCYDGYK